MIVASGQIVGFVVEVKSRVKGTDPSEGYAVTQPSDVHYDDAKFGRRNWTLVFSRFVPQSGSRNRAGSPSAQTPSKPLRPLHPINVDRRTG